MIHLRTHFRTFPSSQFDYQPQEIAFQYILLYFQSTRGIGKDIHKVNAQKIKRKKEILRNL